MKCIFTKKCKGTKKANFSFNPLCGFFGNSNCNKSKGENVFEILSKSIFFLKKYVKNKIK